MIGNGARNVSQRFVAHAVRSGRLNRSLRARGNDRTYLSVARSCPAIASACLEEVLNADGDSGCRPAGCHACTRE